MTELFSGDEVRVLKALAAGLLGATGGGGGQAAGSVADDSELDGQYGNFSVRKDPPEKYWKGAPYAGKTLSECPADYLDAFARWREASAFMNAKDPSADKQKYAGYDRKDAARARGWAKRIRAGAVTSSPASRTNVAPPPPADAGGFGDSSEDDMIPFASNETTRRSGRV